MVKMGTVWDRTIEVLNGRTGMIAFITLVGLALPKLVRDLGVLYSLVPVAWVVGSVVIAALLAGVVLSFVALPFALWAQLAIAAIATSPEITRTHAGRQGRVRLLPALGITVFLGLVAAIAMLPPIVALFQSGFDLSVALSEGSAAQMSPPSAGTVAFIGLYALLYTVLAIWIFARLIVLYPVILNERLGLGAIRRSFTLTRGLTWRIIGALVLFGIVVTIATGATQWVAGTIFGLVLGEAAGLPTTIVVTIVSAAFTAIATVFTAQLYVAVRERLPQE